MMLSFLLIILQQVSEFSTSTHGRQISAPDGILYYLILIVAWLIVIGVFIAAIKYLFWPGEKSNQHIKRKVLEEDWN